MIRFRLLLATAISEQRSKASVGSAQDHRGGEHSCFSFVRIVGLRGRGGFFSTLTVLEWLGATA